VIGVREGEEAEDLREQGNALERLNDPPLSVALGKHPVGCVAPVVVVVRRRRTTENAVVVVFGCLSGSG
jgi:hypothetical protein